MLAAIVLVAVKGLIDVRELRHVWRVSRFEFAISMVAFAAVLLLGILKGVIVAVAGVAAAADPAGRPPARRLPRPHPRHPRFSDMERHPDNEAVPGVLVFRVEASLLYFNVEHVRDAVWEKLRAPRSRRSWSSATSRPRPTVDLAGARMLTTLHAELTAAGTGLRLVDAHASVRDILRAEALETLVGDFGRGTSVTLAVDELQGRTGARVQPA